jgi:hypothetical protein
MSHPSASTSAPRLLDHAREIIRIKHYSIRTEQAYMQWIRRYNLYHGKRHPRDMVATEAGAFLSSLAITAKVSASTQNQALNASCSCIEMSSRFHCLGWRMSNAPSVPNTYLVRHPHASRAAWPQ